MPKGDSLWNKIKECCFGFRKKRLKAQQRVRKLLEQNELSAVTSENTDKLQVVEDPNAVEEEKKFAEIEDDIAVLAKTIESGDLY